MLQEEYHCFPYPFLYEVSRDPAHCARSSILVLGITRYTFLVFPFHSTCILYFKDEYLIRRGQEQEPHRTIPNHAITYWVKLP
jgi:hypothetical protein